MLDDLRASAKSVGHDLRFIDSVPLDGETWMPNQVRHDDVGRRGLGAGGVGWDKESDGFRAPRSAEPPGAVYGTA
jgi:hypothetical protein